MLLFFKSFPFHDDGQRPPAPLDLAADPRPPVAQDRQQESEEDDPDDAEGPGVEIEGGAQDERRRRDEHTPGEEGDQFDDAPDHPERRPDDAPFDPLAIRKEMEALWRDR